MQFLQEIQSYKNESGPVGDLARELESILQDKSLSEKDRADLLTETVNAFEGLNTAQKEVFVRWAVTVAQVAAKAVV